MLRVGGKEVPRGQIARIQLPVARTPTQVMVTVPSLSIVQNTFGDAEVAAAASPNKEFGETSCAPRTKPAVAPVPLRRSRRLRLKF